MCLTDERWGKLTRTDGNASSTPIFLDKDQYSFGRADECDFKFPDNKLLSAKHCSIEIDKIDQKAWFIDHSTNGSILNLKEKIHKKKKKLSHNDVIALVFRKNEPEKNIIYRFEYMQKIPAEFESTQLYNCTEDLDLDESQKIQNDDGFKSPLPICSKSLNNTSKGNKHRHDTEPKDEPVDKKIKIELNVKIEENDSVEKNSKDENQDLDLTDNMTCTICNEIMHDCISLQPCLHSYCAGCYSDWMVKSDECPICRIKVQRIAKNHMVNNIIEAYLKKNPAKKRSKDEIELLDKKNKITQDMLYPRKDGKPEKFKDDYEDSDEDLKKKNNNNDLSTSSSSSNRSSNDSESDSNEGSIFNSENEEDYDDEPDIYNPPYNPFAVIPAPAYNQYFHAPLPNNFNQPFRFTCRQCPQNKIFNPNMNAPDYTCTPFQNHLLCQCCLEAFPDRNNEIARNALIPKQNCSMCFKSYCNLYWGCRKGDCKKCLVKFSDLMLDDFCSIGLINENQYESEIFSDWMVRSGKTVQNIFEECVVKLKNGIYKIGNLNRDDALNKVVCRKCGISLFKELAYQFRKDMPDEEIFNKGVPRPNCHWGKECRTQKHNYDHAK